MLNRVSQAIAGRLRIGRKVLVLLAAMAITQTPAFSTDGGAPDRETQASPKKVNQRAKGAAKVNLPPPSKTKNNIAEPEALPVGTAREKPQQKRAVAEKVTPRARATPKAAEQEPIADPRIDLAHCADAGPDGVAVVRKTNAFKFKPGMEVGFALFGHAGAKDSSLAAKGGGRSGGEVQFRWRYIPAISIKTSPKAAIDYYPFVYPSGEEKKKDSTINLSCMPFNADRSFAAQQIVPVTASLPILAVRFTGLDPTVRANVSFLPQGITGLRNISVGELKLFSFTSRIDTEKEAEVAAEMLSGGLDTLWSVVTRYAAGGSTLFAPWLCRVTKAADITACAPAKSAGSDKKAVLAPRADVRVEMHQEGRGLPGVTLLGVPTQTEVETPGLLEMYQAIEPVDDVAEVEGEQISEPDVTSDAAAAVDTVEKLLNFCDNNSRTKEELGECIGSKGASVMQSAAPVKVDPSTGQISPNAPEAGQDQTKPAGPDDHAALTTGPPEPADKRLPVRPGSADAVKVAFFVDLAACTASLPSLSEASEPVPISQAPPQLPETTAVMVDRDGTPASSCTEAKIGQSEDGAGFLSFPFEAFKAAGPASVYIVSLARGFEEFGLDGMLREALRDALQTASETGVAATLLTIDGSRAVRTIFNTKDIQLLAGLDADKRRRALARDIGQFIFAVRSMQPLADTAQIYHALEGKEVSRIFYVVDSRRESFQATNAGAVFAWLHWSRVPVSILSIGGCDKWQSMFSGLAAELSCTDLEDMSSESKGEIVAALKAQAQQ